MRKVIITLSIMAALFLLFLSQVIKLLPFSYLDFSDGPDVVIAAHGGQDVLFFADSMPIAYRVERPTYTVVIEVEFVSGDPRVEVTVEDDETEFLLRSNDSDHCARFWSLDEGLRDYLTFYWRGADEKSETSCESAQFGSDELTMSFQVQDQAGAVFDERLPFKLVRNGYYLWIDAL